jgi:hypothetical protein
MSDGFARLVQAGKSRNRLWSTDGSDIPTQRGTCVGDFDKRLKLESRPCALAMRTLPIAAYPHGPDCCPRSVSGLV